MTGDSNTLIGKLRKKYPKSFFKLDPKGYIPTQLCNHKCTLCTDDDCVCRTCKVFGKKKTHPWNCGGSLRCSFYED